MAHKERDVGSEERPSERRHRTKGEKDSSRAHKSSRSTKPKIIDPATGEPVKSSHRRRKDKDRENDLESDPSNSMADLVPELARTASAPGTISRSSLPYPSFNKAYSKEAVNSREDFGTSAKKTNPFTPESTDLGSDEKRRSKSVDNTAPRAANVMKDGRPPSPPDTEFSQFSHLSQQRKATPTRMTRLQEDEETESRPSSRNSFFSRTKKDDRSKVSTKSKGSKASTAVKSPRKAEHTPNEEDTAREGHDKNEDIGSRVDSNVTSVAPEKIQPEPAAPRPAPLDTYSSPDSAQDSSPRTPTQTPQFPPPSAVEIKPSPSPFIHFDIPEKESSAYDSPQPPPPPPPPTVPINIPQVDYLMQNGGLPRLAPKTLLSGVSTFTRQGTTQAAGPVPSEIERIFGPFYNVLDQYETVINKNGSIAVATGYRSVARRLLDRLENVFNRDLSSEGCFCFMCQNVDPTEHEGSRGLGWGEVLEWVSNRRELPLWPAFDFATLGVKAADELAGLGISGHHRNASDPVRPGSPVKIDPDIAEEYRDHFLQQSKKTKMAVNRWLSSCPQTAATPPQEVDDETLSFAILTHLDQTHRPLFNTLISGSTVLQPVTRAPTPLRKPRSDFMVKTVQSLQRLYRLPLPPRDPEAAVYLLKNPHIHNLLATLSGISVSEWEILTSGRFDGFLWSGAESEMASPAASRGPTPSNAPPLRSPMSPGIRQATGSRTTTPFSPMRGQAFSPALGSNGFPISRGPTPFSNRHPVSNDEETEIAILAEIEREIYQGMEILEDAFEGLHRKAEMVRRALRERGAGLSISLQSRRTSHPDIISGWTPVPPPAGLGPGYERPAWGDGGSELNSESDWDPGDEMMSEIAPDDSASNISSSRHRRPKRRNERRTPALVEEEDED
ncbi:hypothetical protein D0Z07_3236 [Hyphodiscus hymeniophilus]|uniref:5-Methylcytosine G/T mismatch-specific DNA glycosylase n=1 Tax=Hyphodiscus hymeniophilus TaxID=353542 RepID=A0A9P6VLP6_9HELO|nr:hypothetical protein D0Z07_3236 [Hyphodiscus hymeniophilus]